jgi:tetratricopeptide (TPR) repeat protein/DNA-binding CsgD family transcriptional regulator
MEALLIRILLFLLFLNFLSGSFVNAQDLARVDSLLYLIEREKDDSIRVYLNVAISKAYSKTDVIKSLKYGEKALAIAEKSYDKNLISYALFNMGVSFFYQGILELSVPYFYRYLEINIELKNEKAIAYAMVNIGAIHLNLKQLEEAADNFEQALATFERIYAGSAKPGNETISIYNNLGVVAKDRQQSEIAIDYYMRGISLARRTPGYETELGNLLNNLGNLYLDLGRTEESIQNLTEALQLRVEIDDKVGIVKSYLSLAKYYWAQNVEERRLKYLYLANNLANKVGIVSSSAEAQKFLFEIYQNKQMPDSALKYHLLYTSLNERLNKDAAVKELKHFEISTRFRENERLLKFEHKRRELRYQLAGLTLTLTIVILGFLFYLAYSRNRRLKLEKENAFLNAKNVELEKNKLESELETRNKELATNVMYQIKKNELINHIVLKLQKHSPSDVKKYPNWVLEIIRDLEKTQDQTVWNEFELRFQQVHNDFYKRLNEINSDLSLNERRICAFLRLQMTTKEISSITGQSYRSIEVARTRLRKKLNLTNSETGLIGFLSTL